MLKDIQTKMVLNYIDYLTYQRHYSHYTVQNYKDDILEFFDFLER